MSERDDPGTIGRRVQQWRADRGLTQRQLAEPAYTPAYISTLEAGRVRASDEALRHSGGHLGDDTTVFAVRRIPPWGNEPPGDGRTPP